ncbi:bifunctional glycogen debranching protein GlgX/4-alpha-glucanotransferase [Azotosporobacter soli]|uniref:bifunctional glycogen debranching protein GlgX/4-alpha-glucanotransferase n=1 Tax=Azotosporobacter soli TaxID=3055040 RepID=UPI0031FE528D
MKSEQIMHDSQVGFYRSPFGAVPCGEVVILRLEVATQLKTKEVKLRIWQDGVGERLLPLILKEDGKQKRLYEVRLTLPEQPCLLWYYFIITNAERTIYYGNQADLLGGVGQVWEQDPASFQISVHMPALATPDWYKDAVMYQIFPDRFCNGEPSGKVQNPKQGSLLHSHWDNTPYYVRDPETKRIVAYDFFGGNLKGIRKRLPYLKELGISVIYLNPIFASPSNHRYDVGDYKNIDPMLGDNEEFAELCEAAKEMGIYILLDGVFSHTGSDSIYFNKDEHYPGPGAYQSVQSPYYKWYRFYDYPNKYECWWGVDTLPNVEELEPSYMDYIIEDQDSVIRHWLKLGAKGWRLDVADELPDMFIKKIHRVMKETDPDSVLIGEVWEDASRKHSYGQLRQYLHGDELDSTMNYPFRKAVMEFLLGHADAKQTHRLLMSLYENYPKEIFYALMNLIGSHDVPRIMTLLGEAPEQDSLTSLEQSRYRLPLVRRKLAMARLKLLLIWQMTFPGVPSIYYGDEVGLEGFKDPFNRGTYPWGKEHEELLDWHKLIVALRNRYAVFRTGEWVSLPAHKDVYAYVRQIVNGRDAFGQVRDDNTALILLNRHVLSAITVKLDLRSWCRGSMKDLLDESSEYKIEGGCLTLTLKPLEGKVLLQLEKCSFDRACGVLLHPTSLPGKFGSGDMGKEAYEFVDFLHAAGQKLWQVLPLNPVGFGQSPYQCPSAFAGNPLLISLGRLVSKGLLSSSDLKTSEEFDPDRVDFDRTAALRETLLRKAYESFPKHPMPDDYVSFVADQHGWLKDYALFMALKKQFPGLPWTQWPGGLAERDEAALERWAAELAAEMEYHYFCQYVFFHQWQALRVYANRKGIQIVGDLPIFVAHDSSDVWANQKLFELSADGRAAKVAGVPPDYFSATGQLWGNPHYRWTEMAKDEYHWWRERFRVLLQLVDIIRVDHFRGFEAYWEVDGKEKTAVVGNWRKGPGAEFFRVVQNHFGELPLIVEDLGVITPEVQDLKHAFNFPGIQVLHFSFVLADNGRCHPVICPRNSVTYSGTHDNDTTWGWFVELMEEEPLLAEAIRREVGAAPDATAREVCWSLIEYAYAGNANTVIIPMQDLLRLESNTRMNTPGTVGGENWRWRCRDEYLTAHLQSQMAALAKAYQR